jgi:tetratricopeptide (TPR) repeat protein
MKRFCVLIALFIGISSYLPAQNKLLDSVISISEKYPEISQKIEFLKQSALDTNLSSISMELLQEAKIYSSGYRLPVDTGLYSSLGEKYTDNFMFQQAINIYDTLESFYANAKDSLNWILSIDKKARNYSRFGKDDDALACYQRAEMLAEKTKNLPILFMVKYNFAHFYLSSSNSFDLADEKLKTCYQIAQELDLDSLRIEYYLEMSHVFVYAQKFDSAQLYFTKIQTLIDQLGSFSKIDRFYNVLAVFHQFKGNKEKALDYYLKAYAINLKANDYVGLYVNSYNLHKYYIELKDLENAEKYLLLSLEYANITRIEQYKIATYQDLHLFFAENHNYQKAYEYLLLMNKSVESTQYKDLNAKIVDLAIQYNILKTQDEVKILTQENQIQSLKIRNDKLIIYGLIVLILAAVLYFILIFRQNKIKTKQKTDQLMLKNLIQQMNPHFIFNTLNSIQYYMYNHSELDTNDYISKFATLIRQILENSNKNSITLSEELKSVVLYIELEQLRFNHSFEYQIVIPPEINPDEIRIPSMFIQPFIENSILHGLRHISQKGNLCIQFKINQDVLECTIEDNGIGRNKSDELNARNTPKHSSMALQISTERLKLLGSIYNKKLALRFMDMKEGCDDCGTKVFVELPILKN